MSHRAYNRVQLLVSTLIIISNGALLFGTALQLVFVLKCITSGFFVRHIGRKRVKTAQSKIFG